MNVLWIRNCKLNC